MKIIECVPNFSEGADAFTIGEIKAAICSVEGVKLLHVDPGKGANRTVFTFAGEPQPVADAAFLAIKTAGELIDMRTHKGAHPRMGATDVCPLIPIANISMAETIEYAVKLAKRVGDELQIPVYLYEHAQPDKTRHNLSAIRAGEYEGFFNKIKLPGWKPDFGPSELNAKSGATVIGARDLLIAYNVNLNTASVPLANEIASAVRESGRTVHDEDGNKIIVRGKLSAVKAIGWFISEYGIAQVSMNLTNINVTPIHTAFEEVCAQAAERGVRVTGSELVGLIPLQAILDAGKFFLAKQHRPINVSEEEIIDSAITSLGLSDLAPFKPKDRIIEYLLK